MKVQIRQNQLVQMNKPAKMEPLFELALCKPPPGARGAAQALHAQLRAAILDGRLAAGSRLPATRLAPEFFGVSRNTAVEIYDRLLSEGLVVARQGAGTVVAPPARGPAVSESGEAREEDPRLNPFWVSEGARSGIAFWREGASRDLPPCGIDLRTGLVDGRLFPHDVFRRVMGQQTRTLQRSPSLLRSAQGNQGSRALRTAVARHIAVTRAISCEPHDVLITSGAQQAFDLLAKILVRPGETVVAVENPGYPPMRIPFAAAGGLIAPVPVDEQGLCVEQMPQNAGVICVTPSHQFPLGVAISPARRSQLLEHARRHGSVIIEDDYDGEFRFDGAPLSALRASDGGDSVFYVGTFSKSMLTSLRVGFIVSPRWALRALIAAKNSADWHSPSIVQRSVAQFIGEGHLTRHVRKMRNVYRRRRRTLIDLVERRLGDRATILPSFYGMHLAAMLPDDIDAEEVAARAVGKGVNVHGLARFSIGGSSRNGLVLGYAIADTEALEAAVEVLREAMG